MRLICDKSDQGNQRDQTQQGIIWNTMGGEAVLRAKEVYHTGLG